VAVLDFVSLDGRLVGFGRFIALDLATELKDAASGFILCDRDALEVALAEIARGGTGLVDEEQVAELGKGCGAQAVVWGQHSVLGSSIVIHAELLVVETQEVLATARMKFPRSPDFVELLGVPTSRGSGHSTAPERHLPQTAHVGPLEVRLDSCTFLESRLACKLAVVNASSAPVTVDVLPSSSLIDNQSDRHMPSQVWLDGRSKSADRPVAATLAAGQSVAMELDFESVPRTKKKAGILQVDLQGAGPARFLDFAFDRVPR